MLNIKNKSHEFTAEIEVPKSGAEGVIIAQGANIGGWSLYAKGGKLKYCYNVAGVNHYYVEATSQLPVGEHQVRMEFAYAGGGLGKGGQVTLFVDGKKVGEGALNYFRPWFSRPTTVATSARTAGPPFPRITVRAAMLSTAELGASSSPLPTPPRTRTTSSRRRMLSASRWRASRAGAPADVVHPGR